MRAFADASKRKLYSVKKRLENLHKKWEAGMIQELKDRDFTRMRVQSIVKYGKTPFVFVITHKAIFFRNVLDSQVALSKEERKRFVDDQAAQLTSQENRLALNKLRQRKLMRKNLLEKQRDLRRWLELKKRRDLLV